MFQTDHFVVLRLAFINSLTFYIFHFREETELPTPRKFTEKYFVVERVFV